MKHESTIPVGKRIADVGRFKGQTKYEPEPFADVDSRIEEIHRRAVYVGPVLEEILQAHHGRMSHGGLV
jgi:hypothetical protein